MNILFVSNLSGNLWAGPNNSVPAQIRAQSKFDNVFWYNMNHVKRKEWIECGLNCKNLDDIPSGRLKDFPSPFDNPDIVIFEEFYCFPFNKLVGDVRRAKIPYVIIPRSELTASAQKIKPIKKKVGNFLYFSSFAKKASGIQFLTESEKLESAGWNANGFVIPNGIDIQQKRKTIFSYDSVKASYIGRVEIYQKGLDILIDAIIGIKDYLVNHNFQLTIYGPNRDGALDSLKAKMAQNFIEDLVLFEDCVFGEAKKKVLKSTDVFILTSRFEGLPMGLIEAISFGVPCVATKGTNLAFEIKKADAGWIAENTTESVAETLCRMVQEKSFYTKGKNAFELSKKFSWNNIAKTSHDVYMSILEKK